MKTVTGSFACAVLTAATLLVPRSPQAQPSLFDARVGSGTTPAAPTSATPIAPAPKPLRSFNEFVGSPKPVFVVASRTAAKVGDRCGS